MMNRNLMLAALVALIAGVGLFLFSNLPTTSVEAALRNGQEVVIDAFTVPVHLQSDQCEFATDVSKMNSPWFPNGERIAVYASFVESEFVGPYSVEVGKGLAKVSINENCRPEEGRQFALWYDLFSNFNFSEASSLEFTLSEVKGEFVFNVFISSERFEALVLNELYSIESISDEDIAAHTSFYYAEADSDTKVSFKLSEPSHPTGIQFENIRTVVLSMHGNGSLILTDFNLLP